MIKHIKTLLSTPTLVTSGIAFISIFALASALTAEHVFGLKPCILCLYQRVPYVATALLGLAGLLAALKKKPKAAAGFIILCAIAFAGEAALAFYHVGVEQHWWRSFLESCATPNLGETLEDLKAAIENAQAVRCDQIPWQMFGISMAGYNVIMAAGLASGSAISAKLILKSIPKK